MKNYYEILGIDEEATQEEIRARWAELNKLYHPDVLQSPDADDRIKDINAAYQVLKEYSTRLEYDLERALRRSILKKSDERKRVRLGKILLPVGLAAALIVIGAFVFFYKSPQVFQGPIKVPIPAETARVVEPKEPAKPAKPEKPVEVAKVIPREPVKVVVPEPPKIVEPKPKKPEKPKEPEKPKKSIEVAKAVIPEVVKLAEPKKPKEPDKRKELEKRMEPARVVIPEPPKVVELKKREELERKRREGLEERRKREELAERKKQEELEERRRREELEERKKSEELAERKQQEELAERKRRAELEERRRREGLEERRKREELAERKQQEELAERKRREEREKLREPEKPLEVAKVVEPEKPKVSGEEEVRKFFGGYVEKYNQRDAEGFFSFFSSRAIQNQKYGMDGIKKIYANFFDKSQELRYQLKDMQVNPYPNGLEIKARYELNQISKEGGEKKVWRGQARWVLVKEDGVLKILSLDYQHQK